MISIDINVFKGNEEEEWRPVVRFPGYEVSDKGSVRSFKSRKVKILKPGKDSNGYPVVGLYKDGKRHWLLIHRLVAEAFLEKPGCDYETNHLDGDKTNNHVDNLDWVTRSENLKHAFRTGLKSHKGDKNPCAKLTESEVFEILEMLDAGVPQKEIAEIFNIAINTVSQINTGKRWAHLTTRTPEKPRLKNSGESTPITINLNFWFKREAI